MDFIESRLLGIQVDESGREAVLTFVDKAGSHFSLELHGLERLLVSELRQQNVVEEVIHWTKGVATSELRQAAFALMAGVSEEVCDPTMARVVHDTLDRVARGESELLEITAIFGAQILALFASMTLRDRVTVLSVDDGTFGT